MESRLACLERTQTRLVGATPLILPIFRITIHISRRPTMYVQTSTSTAIMILRTRRQHKPTSREQFSAAAYCQLHRSTIALATEVTSWRVAPQPSIYLDRDVWIKRWEGS